MTSNINWATLVGNGSNNYSSIGIGTSNDGASYKLDINGNVRIQNGFLEGTMTSLNVVGFTPEIDPSLFFDPSIGHLQLTHVAGAGGITPAMEITSETGNVFLSPEGSTFPSNVTVTGNIEAQTFKIGGSNVMTSNSLGSGITSSSLTSVGTLSSLNVSGNVGVGTATARQKVHINVGTNYNMMVRQVNNAVQIYGANDLGTGYSALTIDGSSTCLNGNSVGRVGVGTLSPISDLHLHLTSTGGWSTSSGLRVGGVGASKGFMQIGADVSNGRGWIQPFLNGASENTGSYGKLSLCEAGGFVGIGTNNPSFPLHVASSSTGSDPLFQHGFLNSTGAGNGGSQNGNLFSIQAKFTGVVHADTYRAVSDVRIKKDISEINDGEALDKLRVLQPKKYKYIDEISKGSTEVYGFIAQEVRQVLPEAIAFDQDAIPDVYMQVSPDMTARTLRLGVGKSKTGKLRIITLRGAREIQVEAVGEDMVRFTEGEIVIDELKDNILFVYGYEVSDFHTMKKDFLWAINFAATQELDRKLNNLIATLTSKNLI